MPQVFDPRGRTNRALLVGVSEYDNTHPKDKHGVAGDLKAVRQNLAHLEDALEDGKIFAAGEITLCRPRGVDDFTEELNKAVDSADGLLLFYFAGHGAIPSAGDELWLQMRNARVVAGSEAVFQGSQPWTQVLGTLASSRAQQVVVILDCCYAGNAARVWEAFGAKRNISQLMSVQANNLIDAGQGKRPTPFTEQLVRILRGGIGGEGGDVGFHALSEELRAYMTKHHRTKRPETWEPQSRPGTSGIDVLLATDLPPVTNEVSFPWWRRKAVVATAAAALVAALGLGVFALSGGFTPGNAQCAPPLELRLLTDPGIESTVAKAAGAYMTSGANQTDDGCRRSGITTYSAGSAGVVAAFRDDTAAWQQPSEDKTNPQRDIGAQPDIWIPATSADVERARPESGLAAATLNLSARLASSPIVLAVPDGLAHEQTGPLTGKKLTELVTMFHQTDEKAEVRRAAPEFTDAALLATVGLYAGAASEAQAEDQVAQPGLPSATGGDLLCELPKTDSADKATAALVPEHLLKTGVACDSLRRTPRSAEYPVDVPGLDPAFVQVTWDHADRDKDARNEAVDGFQKWLTGKDGAAVFGGDGFRGPVEEGAGSPKGLTVHIRGTVSDPGKPTGPTSGDVLDDTLRRYQAASGPGRVLFLLDSSGSMADKWDGPSGAPGILKQSLGGLGTQDEYGVWAVGQSDGAKGAHTELLALGQHKTDDAAKTLDRHARAMDVEADPSGALTAALDTMARGTDKRPQLIVYLTDDEDNDKLTGPRLDALLSSARDKKIPVAMVSLENGGCAPGKPDALIATATGGRCLDATQSDLVSGLRDEVATTGSGVQG